MKHVLFAVVLLALVAPASHAQTWFDSFDTYNLGPLTPQSDWEEWDTSIGDFAIRYSRFDSSSFSWTPAQPVSLASGMSVNPRVLVTPDGVHVAWEDWSAGVGRVQHRRLANGSWSSIAEVTSAAATANARDPALTLQSTGSVLVAWTENEPGRSEVRSRRITA